MLYSQSDQASVAATQFIGRTPDSVAFQEAWESAKGVAPFPRRDAIELRRFAPFASLMAIIEVDKRARALPFRLSGSGFFDLFGFDLTGMDYLDLVDPAIRDGAFESVLACLSQPCGLWQSTPTEIAGGAMASFELTIFPISKNGVAADHILVFVTREKRPDESVPVVQSVQHSTVWQWIDLGFGLSDISV